VAECIPRRHAYRAAAASGTLAAIVLCAPLLVLARRRWAVVALQIGLGLAAIEWILIALANARERAARPRLETRLQQA